MQPDLRALTWTATACERARQLRIETARRLTLEMSGQDGELRAAQRLDDAIVVLPEDGQLGLLAREYRRALEQERETERILLELLQEHPAGGWIREVPGVDPAAAGLLLARLDPGRAPTPSAFWSYCGLATVPGVVYRCTRCSAEFIVAECSRPPSGHTSPGSSAPCEGGLRQLISGTAPRVPQPKARAGDRALYDPEAKRIVYTIGHGLRGAGHLYQSYYLHQRRLLDTTRPDWASGRKHVTALRKMQKLFLAHLWLVWRESVGLPLTEPTADASLDARWSGPWVMTRSNARRWNRRDKPQLLTTPQG
ncbi:hypothetical protein BH23GEM6_BH23GEM6_21520 [soil metagenome]